MLEIAAYDTVFLRHTRGATALLPLETLKEILGQDNGYSEILIEAAGHTTTNDLISELRNALDTEKYRVSEIVNEMQIAADARQKSMPFFLISFFSLTMSIFIIYSSYKVITLDRLPVIGTFRSIGATKKAVTRILLLESLFYGCIGGLIGIPVGIFVLKAILQGMGKTLSQGIEIPVIISLPGAFLSFTVAVTVSLLSAWLPVRRASRLPIKDVVLGTVEERHIPHPLIVGIGTILFAISVFLPHLASGNMLYLTGGFSLLGLIAATILVIPIFTNILSGVFERIFGAIAGNEGRIAARNMKDNKNTTQNITVYDFLAYTAADPDAIMVQIRALFGETSNWSRTVEEFNSDALSTVGAFLEPMHTMTYFILLLATVGVINNLLINYMQKRRTIAMYKSIGLSNRQNRKMTLIEGFSSGLIGAVIAIFVSYMEIQTIFLVAAPKISMLPELDLWTFFAAGGLGIFITLLGSIVPIIKSRNMKLVEEIKFE